MGGGFPLENKGKGEGEPGGWGVGWGPAKEPASQCARVCQNYPLAIYPLVSLLWGALAHSAKVCPLLGSEECGEVFSVTNYKPSFPGGKLTDNLPPKIHHIFHSPNPKGPKIEN